MARELLPAATSCADQGTAQGRRKQLARAIDRVAKELGLEEAGYD